MLPLVHDEWPDMKHWLDKVVVSYSRPKGRGEAMTKVRDIQWRFIERNDFRPMCALIKIGNGE